MPQTRVGPALQNYLDSPDEQYATEAAIIGSIVRKLVATTGHVNNRAIILALVNELESKNNPIHQDVLRNCLQIVVGHTPDENN
ncbi:MULTISPECIES: biofilm development regulator YmgB/AriR family protein [Erwiniaceae]|uniref:biofilm development regulator YmgB/AriR family protein n=1 Tax=Erwiniaceae TaxID=1903409 RepID=UPI00190D4FFE|nr:MULTISPECIES: biofilm development regulator YmgB/AriR family protein [Erwiniaceae]MBK0091147.1 transcriptional regulator [Erwinia sp. S59]MBK0122535.1 transcriptional regulator [Pantoea sp. S61]MBK0122756.1 transcriptional regulator [Pantoea sp. S61]